MSNKLLPCPFCGGAVRLERTTSYYDNLHGDRKWWGVVCRNTENVGGSCAIQQRPSASEKAAVDRWNRRVSAPKGFQLVPVEPTRAMLEFVIGTSGANYEMARERYAEMLAAASQPPGATTPKDQS